MLGGCNLSVIGCMSNCSCIFLCVVERQWYVKRRKGLELELCRWTTSEIYLGIGKMDKDSNEWMDEWLISWRAIKKKRVWLRRMLYDMSEWRGLVRREWALDFDVMTRVLVATAEWNPWKVKVYLWPTLQPNDSKRRISLFSFHFSFASFLFSLISWHDACRPCGGGTGWYIMNK